MRNIWTTTSQYGTYSDGVNPVSTSTTRRWLKEERSKKHQSRSMRKHNRETVNA
jgi:hypothetical protein